MSQQSIFVVSAHSIGLGFLPFLHLSRHSWGKDYLLIPWYVSLCLVAHCFKKYEIHTEREMSLNLKCVSHGREAAQRLYQSYYIRDRLQVRKKNNQMNTVCRSALHPPLTLTYSVTYDWGNNFTAFWVCLSPYLQVALSGGGDGTSIGQDNFKEQSVGLHYGRNIQIP